MCYQNKKINVFQIVILLVCLFLTAQLIQAQTETQGLKDVLVTGQTIEKELKTNEKHSYQIKLLAGEYLKISVEQKGIDVTLLLLDDKLQTLAQVSYFNSFRGVENIFWIAQIDGVYQLEIKPSLKEAPTGNYQIQQVEIRKSLEQDNEATLAQRLVYEGASIFTQGAKESFPKAIEKYETAIVCWQKLGNKELEAIVTCNTGLIYNIVGEKQKALNYLNKALTIVGEINNKSIEALTLNGLGAFYGSSGDFKRSLEYFEKSLIINQEINDLKNQAANLNNLGNLYSLTNNYQKALESLNQASKIFHTLKDERAESGALNNLGTVYTALGDYERSLVCYEDALPLKQRLKDRRGECYLLNNIGFSYSALGDYQKALDNYNKSLAIVSEISDRRSEASTLSNIGDVYSKLKDYQKALDYYKKSLPIKQAVLDRSSEIVTLNNMAKVYGLQKDFDKSLEIYQQALSIGKALNDLSNQAQTHYGQAYIKREKGELVEAQKEIEEAINIIESIRSKVVSQELKTSYLASTRSYYEFDADLLMRLHKQKPDVGYDSLALQVSEKSIARNLLETLNEARANIKQGITAKLLEQEQRLRQELNEKANVQARMLKGKYTLEQAEAIAKEINGLTREYEELQTQIRKESPRYAGLIEPVPLSAKEIQERVLDKNTVLLEYLLGDEQSYLWVVSNSSITTYLLPSRGEIEKLARPVYTLLTIRNQKQTNLSTDERRKAVEQGEKDYLGASENLAKVLFQDIISKNKGKRFLVVADGILHYIPFAALPDPETNQPLIIDNEVVNLPSASILAGIRQEGKEAFSKTIAVLADPVFALSDSRFQHIAKKTIEKDNKDNIALTKSVDKLLERSAQDAFLSNGNSASSASSGDYQLPRLLATKEEAEAIISFTSEKQNKLALGFEANKLLATSSELKNYRFLHFATHGLLNSLHPELSGIVLSLVNEKGEIQDGFLRLNDIYNLELPNELVVLSACQTGLGKEIKGEGIIGLTRGFMYAGTKTIMASLWKVDDDATSELMRYFYKAMLKDGLKPSAALRNAQVMMVKQKRWKSPFYWAAFTIQGEYN